MNPQAWQLQLALGACRAGRLLVLASLACALFALALLTCQAGPESPMACALWSLVVLAVLPALYLGARLELDRGLFQRLADTQDAGDDSLAALDQALAGLGWKVTDGSSRPLADRVGGVGRLAKRLGGLVTVQIGAMLTAALIQ